jgi:hypothetical protein
MCYEKEVVEQVHTVRGMKIVDAYGRRDKQNLRIKRGDRASTFFILRDNKAAIYSQRPEAVEVDACGHRGEQSNRERSNENIVSSIISNDAMMFPCQCLLVVS